MVQSACLENRCPQGHGGSNPSPGVKNIKKKQTEQKMKIRKGVAVVIFARINNKKKYLILKRKLHWNGWELLKGGLKNRENENNAIRREIKEETGKSFCDYILKKTKYSYSFVYQKLFVHDKILWNGARNRVYAAEFNNFKIKLDKNEHSGFKWVSKKDALKLLTWTEQKKVLRKI